MTIHVKATVDSEGQLTVRDLPLQPGQEVQLTIITVDRKPTDQDRYPLRGTPYRFIDPTEPATDPEDWEMNR
jgi:hypothetical protein